MLRNAANLDILRTAAVLLVLFDHVCETISRKTGVFIHPIDWGAGRLGVLLFFVHTSLVLNYSMERLGLRGWALAKSFFIRRAFRIYPLSALCVLLVVAFKIPTMPWEQFHWKGYANLMSNLALTMNLTFSEHVLGPMWSLPLEVQMYLALPAVFLLLGQRHRIRVSLLLWAVSIPIALAQPHVSDRASVLGFVPCFMGGVVAYACGDKILPRIDGIWWTPFLIFLIATYLAIQVAIGDVFFQWTQWCLCLILGLAIPLFSDSSLVVLNRSSAWVAQHSYGIYLFHCLALSLLFNERNTLPEWLSWIMVLLLIWGASVLSFRFLERPAIALGAVIARRASLGAAAVGPRATS